MKIRFIFLNGLGLLTLVGCGFFQKQSSRTSNTPSSLQLGTYQIPYAIPVLVSATEVGYATSNIPLENLAVGNGFGPKLSLVYSSAQAEQGLAGAGWNLSGMSVISRCPSHLIFEGIQKAIEWSDGDAYCLDGKKLHLTMGVQGAENSEYEPYLFEGKKVRFAGEHFEVFTKSGEHLFFGTSNESREDGLNGKPYSYYLDKILDRSGNSIAFSYEKEGNRLYLSRVSYGGNEPFGKPHYRSTTFKYEKSKSEIKRFVSGQTFVGERLLKEIQVGNAGNVSWTYRLHHQQDSFGRLSILKAIDRCYKDGSCTPQTSFTYEQTDGLKISESPEYQWTEIAPNKTGVWSAKEAARSYVDLNNDGRIDLLGLRKDGLTFALSNSGGLSPSVDQKRNANFLWNPLVNLSAITDMNRDGFNDVVLFVEQGNNPGVYVAYWNGKGFDDFEQISKAFGSGWNVKAHIRAIIDLNNDSWPDIIGSRADGIYVAYNDGKGNFAGGDAPIARFFLATEGWSRVDYFRYFLDANADGYTDIIGFHERNVQVSLGTGHGFLPPKVWIEGFGRQAYNPASMPRDIVDMNADGLPDLLAFGVDGVDVSLNNGTSFTQPSRWQNGLGLNQGWTASTAKDRLVFDMNRDGYPDLVGFQKNSVEVYLGSGVPNPELAPIKLPALSNLIASWNNRVERVQLEDLDGNGKTDLFLNLLSGLWKAEIANQRIRLTGVKTGLGDETLLTYGLTTDPTVYQQTKKVGSDFLPVVGALEVVREVRRSNGIGGYSSVRYSYENAAYDRGIFGFLGFEKRKTSNLNDGTETIETFSQDRSNLTQGALVSSEVFSVKDQRKLLSRVTNHWNSPNLSPHPLHRALQDVASESNFFDERGNVSYTVTIEKSFDAFQNVRQLQTILTDKSGRHGTQVNTLFLNDPAHWVIGLPEDITTKSYSSTSDEVVVKRAAFSYDANGLLLSEISEPDSSFWIKKEYSRTRNGFGLVDGVRTTWSRELSRGLPTDFLESRSDFDGRGFLERSFNALNQETSQSVDPENGLVRYSRDFNGLLTHYTYDSAQRIQSITEPDGRKTLIERRFCDSTCPKNAVLMETTSSNGFGHSKIYLDVLGRTIHTVKSLYGEDEVAQDFLYGTEGLLAKTSKPYFTSSTAQYWTTISYDERNRQKTVSKPDNSRYEFIYDGLRTTTIDELGRSTVHEKDSRGLLLSLKNVKNETIHYSYDGGGRLREIRDPGNNVTRLDYDVYGRRTGLFDLTTGATVTEYNALSLPALEKQGQRVTERRYDVLGRTTQMSITAPNAGGITERYTYDSSSHGIGMISSIEGPDSRAVFGYDEFSRPSTTERLLLGRSYSESMRYDALGRIDQKVYPNGLTIQYAYDAVGRVQEIIEPKSGRALWTLQSLHSNGAIEKFKLGNGSVARKVVDERSDRIVSETVIGRDQAIQLSRTYSHDVLGNLLGRKDDVSGISESFGYDDLNRLQQFTGPNLQTVSMKYDELSRISSRSDIGSYSYGKGCGSGIDSPFVPKTIGSTNYCSDERGNIIQAGERRIRYDLTNLPVEIEDAGRAVHYKYGFGKRVLSKEETIAGDNVLTSYVGQSFEIEKNALGTRERAYVGDFLVIETEGTDYRENYLYKDYLGSTLAVADQDGFVIERLDYEPFGQRRKVDDLGRLEGGFKPKATSRGFTGHDHIESMNLVHMKGRVYDPTIGLFLTPDPLIQDPTLVQNLNRYSYVINNPLSYTDPSGHSFESIAREFERGLDTAGKAISNPGRFIESTWNKLEKGASDPRYLRLTASIALSVVATVFCPAWASASWYQSAAYYAAVGYTSSYVATNGDKKAALNGALTGAAFNLVGSAFESAKVGGQLSTSMQIAKLAAHGVVGGLSAQANGGKFESGFWSAGLSQAAGQFGAYEALGASENAQGWGIAYNAGVAAVVGGTVSELTGGSFEQGALDAAMGRLFNDMAHVATLSPLLGGLAAIDGPFPVGDVAAAGVAAGALVYGDEVVEWVNGKIRTWSSESTIDVDTHPSTPVGHQGHEIKVAPGTNSPTQIEGRDYTGHSLDRMQGRGVPPSVVEDTITNGISRAGKRPGTIEYKSKENGVRVITNESGGVITVIPR